MDQIFVVIAGAVTHNIANRVYIHVKEERESMWGMIQLQELHKHAQ